MIVVGYSGEPRLFFAVEDYVEGEVGDPSPRTVADTAGRPDLDVRTCAAGSIP